MNSSDRPTFIKTEDGWAILIGLFILITGLIVFFEALPDNYKSLHQQYNLVMENEQAEAPFRTIKWYKAYQAQQDLRMDKTPVGIFFINLTGKPHSWTANPIQAFFHSEIDTVIRGDKNQASLKSAQEVLDKRYQEAEKREGKARTENFKNEELNRSAKIAIAEWLDSREKTDKLIQKSAGKNHNQIPYLFGLFIIMALVYGIGTYMMDRYFFKFIVGLLYVFVIGIIAYFLSAQSTMRTIGFGYAAWAIIIGLLISNTIGTPSWVKPAVKTEYFIKTGLVLLGAEILFGKILSIGLPGIFVAWVVTPIILVVTFWFGQKVLKITSKTLNITISADMSVCGVSAAVAVAAACRAKKEELTLAIGLSMVFTSVMMILLPLFINWTGMPEVLGGAWIGGTIDATGAVVAAGAFLGENAMMVAATIKMIQNVLIGVIAFFVAIYFTMKVENKGAQKISAIEIWYRFPKFILGFIGASIVFSGLYSLVGIDLGYTVIDQGIIGAYSKNLRGWFFCLSFVSIGLATNFKELKSHFKGGKPLILYVSGQTFNLALTLLIAYIMFYRVFPEITDMFTN